MKVDRERRMKVDREKRMEVERERWMEREGRRGFRIVVRTASFGGWKCFICSMVSLYVPLRLVLGYGKVKSRETD